MDEVHAHSTGIHVAHLLSGSHALDTISILQGGTTASLRRKCG